MINKTASSLIINFSGNALKDAVRASLVNTSRAMLKVHGRTTEDIKGTVDQRPAQTAFSRVIENETIKAPKGSFDAAYVQLVFDINQRHHSNKLRAEEYQSITLTDPAGALGYMPTRAHAIRTGLRTFLVALHSTGAITLPAAFDWPSPHGSDGKRLEVGHIVGNELLTLIRQLSFQEDSLVDAAFSSIGTNQKRKEWFLTYGTKLLLATGWQTAKDASLQDLKDILNAEKAGDRNQVQSSYKALVDVLSRKYGSDFPITVEEWSKYARTIPPDKPRTSPKRNLPVRRKATSTPLPEKAQDWPRSDADVLAEILKVWPSAAYPEAILTKKTLPGLEIELTSLAEKWIEIETLYIRRTPRENYQTIRQALGYLNIYLFHYLPYWFQRNKETPLIYPRTPSQLVGGVFISRLMDVAAEVPKTLTEVLNLVAEAREWRNTSHFGILKQIEVFFQFVERNSLELEGCAGFKQPLTPYDYPPVSRPYGTNKSPIPRRLFNVFLDYVEALRAYSYRIIDGVASDTIDGKAIEARTKNYATVIDTFALSSLVGVIPVLFAKGKTIPLQFIPNVLLFQQWKLRNGHIKCLPAPHALNQIIAALHTGLRHNHIQWLDERTFDSRVDPNDIHYSLLCVNTDKASKTAWTPYVNIRVIEILRSQKYWRSLIDEPSFSTLHFYNNNEQTKWAEILPLFASDAFGKPHPDSRYNRAWKDILCAIQGLLPELGEQSLMLCSLEPPNIEFNDPQAKEKRLEYGRTLADAHHATLEVKSRITPHSARVSVVSQYITFLPPELIGRYFTGQRPAVVSHYAVLEPGQLDGTRAHQAMVMRELSLRESENGDPGSRFIKADAVNSSLAKSLRKDVQETLISHGCVSITLTEGPTSGLDVLRETRGVDAVANKTEICPYGNHCPPEILKLLGDAHRCALCPYAVRSIDHLPAIQAERRKVGEQIEGLSFKIQAADTLAEPTFSEAELDRLELERQRLGEEASAWEVVSEVLEITRVKVKSGQHNKIWIVEKPEIILRDLEKVDAPSGMTAYLLSRMQECAAFPTSESPQIRARIDILRREILFKAGKVADAFSADSPISPAAECTGLLRSIAAANGFSYDDLVSMLETQNHLSGLTNQPPRVFLLGES